MIARFFILASLMICTSLFAQDTKNAYRVEGNDIVLYLNSSWSRADQEKLLVQSGMEGLSLDTLWDFGHLGRFAKAGWNVERRGRRVKIFKSITQLSTDLKWEQKVEVNNELSDEIIRQTTAEFGVNHFRKPSVIQLKDGATRFFLQGKTQSREVFLSGTFNGWSTLKTPMTKTDSGWVADVMLKAGKHCYKFIVAGRWMTDPDNLQSENDGYGNTNSIYFITNFEFKLKGYLQAREVVLSGSFNNWKRYPAMTKTADGWRVPVYLKDGTYEYKFIVDNTWITDPANTTVNRNGNSYLQIGTPFYFHLKGRSAAKQVFLSGEFNHWATNEKMNKTSDGWELPYTLAPGNYQYKFIVDGEWITDPENPHRGSLDGFTNSVAVVGGNYTFLYKNANARNVKVAGNFNDWTGYDLKKQGDDWKMTIYLRPGKTLYKFIVDGKWILDPANKLWEQNEHDTGNSVMWKVP